MEKEECLRWLAGAVRDISNSEQMHPISDEFPQIHLFLVEFELAVRKTLQKEYEKGSKYDA
jgi:hypothetical protein